MAESMLRCHRLSRRQLSLSISPAAVEYEPGDVISLPDGPAGRFLITCIDDGAVRRIEARETGSGETAGDYSRRKKRRRGRAGNRDFSPVVHLMDLARYRDGAGVDFSCSAVLARPWRRVALSVSAESENYDKRAVATRPAKIGRLVSALPAGPTASVDWRNVIEVKMCYGGLSSVSAVSQLNGGNRIAIRAQNGGWEILSFRRAEEVSLDIWQLSGLLRGLAGTEDAMIAGAAIDAPFVVLDLSVTPLGLEASEAGLSLNWIAEAYGASGGRAGPFAFAGGVRAETPLAPVHLRAERLATGDIALSWVRRSRVDADNWEGDDIPLDETVEAYRVQILDDGEPVRTVSVTEPAFLYTEAMELSDFGASLDTIAFRVRQKGARVALGIAAEKAIGL